MLGQSSTPDNPAAVASPERKRGLALWMGLAAAAMLVLAAGGYYFATSQPSTPVMAAAPAVGVAQEKAVQTVPDDQRQQEQAELARLRAEAAAREKAEQELAAKRQVEEEIRRKIEAETAERKRLEEEAKQKADAEAAAKRKAEEDERKALEAAEAALQLGKVDRQHIQVALVALGFDLSLLDGTLGRGSRDMITAWQKARSYPATGFLTGPQYQALLQEAAPAVSKFDDEQTKIEEERRRAATRKASVDPDIVPMEDNKWFTLYLARGQKCGTSTPNYIARVFANKLDIQFRGDWRTFAADKVGNFARSFPSLNGTFALLVEGNLKTRLVSVENLSSRCLWKGSF